ncbi:hypothetical protein PR003_g11813 [Phytophthora rubi]|uniref:Uncharacterized protein n=1 Tax=Phytophthora rubi TaxID=129364 RepID=A0A6A3LL11_9STRA|nr:hypothetical protein PR002_g12970 [Phytophthora rubi]KAE9337832.1 hypothetical protein PR003_g11813 [Phytophthora rubi]
MSRSSQYALFCTANTTLSALCRMFMCTSASTLHPCTPANTMNGGNFTPVVEAHKKTHLRGMNFPTFLPHK